VFAPLYHDVNNSNQRNPYYGSPPKNCGRMYGHAGLRYDIGQMRHEDDVI
jgi:hypothetical protein